MAVGQIFIVDETGAANRIGTDSGRNAAIAGSAGISRLSANGVAFCGAAGVLQSNRVVSASVNPSSGSVSIAQGGTATVSTTGGRQPLVTLTNGVMAFRVIFTTSCQTDYVGTGNCSLTGLATNSFTITNNTGDSSNGHCTPPGGAAPSYVWV